jgi:uncharacterized protein (UPF0276 family)
MNSIRTNLGHGIGLRPKHFSQFLAERPQVAWLEAVSENFMAKGGRPLAVLEKVRAEVPVAVHGVSLSIGSTDPLDERYLDGLAALVTRIEPAIVSDHLCWGSHGGRYAHDLWPLPYTEEAVAHVAGRVARVQEKLKRRILLENVSSYVTWRASTMPEWEFLTRVAERADCGILLDVNNIYVSARNHGFDARAYLAGVPAERVGQFHLAGHTDKGQWLLDSHDAPVPDPVWDLYREAVRRFGPVPTLIEWDDNIPPLETLVGESRKAAAAEREALA